MVLIFTTVPVRNPSFLVHPNRVCFDCIKNSVSLIFSTPLVCIRLYFNSLALRKQDKERNPLLGRSGFFVVMLLGGCWARSCETNDAEVRFTVVLLIDSEELDALAFGHSQ